MPEQTCVSASSIQFSCNLCRRFERCCDNAFKAALKLVAWAGNKSEKNLEEVYRHFCAESGSEAFDSVFVEEDEIDDYADFDLKNQSGHDVAHEVLQQVQHETVFVDPDIEDKENLIGRAETEDPDLHEILKKSDTESEKSAVCPAGEVMPATLQEAMNSRGCTWNALFRLLVRLRSAKGGSDSRWISNPRRSRRASTTLNWHQCLGAIVGQWHIKNIGVSWCVPCCHVVVPHMVPYSRKVKP